MQIFERAKERGDKVKFTKTGVDRWRCDIDDDELFIMVQGITSLEDNGYGNYDWKKGHDMLDQVGAAYDAWCVEYRKRKKGEEEGPK